MRTPRLLPFVVVLGCVSTTTKDTTETDSLIMDNVGSTDTYSDPNSGWYTYSGSHSGDTDADTDTDTDADTDADTDTYDHSSSGNAGWYDSGETYARRHRPS